MKTLTEKYFDKKGNREIRNNIKLFHNMKNMISSDDLMISGGDIYYTLADGKGKRQYTISIDRELKLNKLGI